MDSVLAGIIFIMILLMLILSSCKHEPMIIPKEIIETGNGNGQSTCDPDTAYFQTQILPLLLSNCTRSTCHNSTDHADGIILDSYANVMATADVDPGRPGNSVLYGVLLETDPDDRMPKGAQPLSADKIELIFDWIDQGARNNSCSNNCDTTNVTFSGTILPLIQNNCLGCHSGGTPGGQIDLSNHLNISVVALNGRLFGAVNHDPGFQPMPRGGSKLQQCRIDQIRIWIQDGAINN